MGLYQRLSPVADDLEPHGSSYRLIQGNNELIEEQLYYLSYLDQSQPDASFDIQEQISSSLVDRRKIKHVGHPMAP